MKIKLSAELKTILESCNFFIVISEAQLHGAPKGTRRAEKKYVIKLGSWDNVDAKPSRVHIKLKCEHQKLLHK